MARRDDVLIDDWPNLIKRFHHLLITVFSFHKSSMKDGRYTRQAQHEQYGWSPHSTALRLYTLCLLECSFISFPPKMIYFRNFFILRLISFVLLLLSFHLFLSLRFVLSFLTNHHSLYLLGVLCLVVSSSLLAIRRLFPQRRRHRYLLLDVFFLVASSSSLLASDLLIPHICREDDTIGISNC